MSLNESSLTAESLSVCHFNDPHQATTVEMSEVIGDIARSSEPLTLGQLLCLLDVVSTRCAYHYGRKSIVTGCFDSIEVLVPPCHGDIAKCIASILEVDIRSMLVQQDVYFDARTTCSPATAPTHALR